MNRVYPWLLNGKSDLKREFWLYVSLCLCLLSFAFYNEFPLLTGDSAVYIESAFSLKAMAERPVFYGIFLRTTTLGLSLWGAIIAQNLLLSWLLIKLIRAFVPGLNRVGVFFIVLILVMTTGVAWESNKIMPDIFASIQILAMLLFLIESKKITRWLLSVLIIWSAAMHNSHFIIGLLIVSILWLITFIKRDAVVKIRLVWLTVILMIAPILVVFSNLWSGNGAVLGKATPVFLVGKLCENGMLKVILDENCEKENWKLCAYRNELPHTAWQFVWDPESPVMKEGGWKPMESELNDILQKSVSRADYMGWLVLKIVQTTGIQLAQVSSGDALFRYEETDNIVTAIHKYFPSEVNPSLWTRQRILELDFKQYNQWYLRSFGLLFMLFILNWKQILNQKNFIHWSIFILSGILVNAIVTANLANISSRLQARVFYLIPLIMIIALTKVYLSKYRYADFFNDVEKEDK